MSDRAFFTGLVSFAVVGMLGIAVFALNAGKNREAFEMECIALGGEYVEVRASVPKAGGSTPLCFAPGVLLRP